MKRIKILLPALLIFLLIPSLNGQKLAKDDLVATWNFSPKEEVNIITLESFLLNEWWPAQGESSEQAIEAMKNLEKFEERFDSMAEMKSWNDWLLLK